VTYIKAETCHNPECWTKAGEEPTDKPHVHVTILSTNGEPMPGIKEIERGVREIVGREEFQSHSAVTAQLR